MDGLVAQPGRAPALHAVKQKLSKLSARMPKEREASGSNTFLCFLSTGVTKVPTSPLLSKYGSSN